jgi:hypothetical protein
LEEYLESQGSIESEFLCVALGKIPTLDNLRKRKVIVVDWCCMCKRSREFIDHLLRHCKVARELWTSIFPFFGVE